MSYMRTWPAGQPETCEIDQWSGNEKRKSQDTMSPIWILSHRRLAPRALARSQGQGTVSVVLADRCGCWIHSTDQEGSPGSWEAASICMG